MYHRPRIALALVPFVFLLGAACMQSRATHLPDPPATASKDVVTAHGAADGAFQQCAETHNAARFPWALPVAAGFGAVAVVALGAAVAGAVVTPLWASPGASPYVSAVGLGGFGLVAVASAAVAAVFGGMVPGAMDRSQVRAGVLKSAEAEGAEALSANDERALHALARHVYEDCRVAASAADAGGGESVLRDYKRYRRELSERDEQAAALDAERADLTAITQKQQALLDEKIAADVAAQGAIAAKEQRIAALQDSVSERNAEIGALKGEVTRLEDERALLSSREQKLLEEKRKLAEKTSEYAAVAGALRAEVQAGALQVRRLRNGVVVEMQNQVLFPSGSAELNEKGNATLLKVGEAIKSIKGQRIRIEGHTDNVPTGKNSDFPSNWDLSAARALAVTKFLQEAGVDPSIMSAEGRSQYAPVSSNRSAKGRSKNRRIEIYLVPQPKGSKQTWRPEPGDETEAEGIKQ